MRKSIKKLIVYAWEWLYLKGVCPALQKKAVIFMLHRMSSPNVIEEGHSAEFLDQALQYLSKKGYQFVSLADIVNNINDGGPPLKKAIAFTLDDGFIDQAKIAAPVFIKHDCPATIFLITQFVDKGQPPWDFLLKFIFYSTNKKQITVNVNSESINYQIDTREKRYQSMVDFRSQCKRMSTVELESALLSLSENVEKEVIESLNESAISLSWDDARELEKSGITFGSHTVNHAILSKCSDQRAKQEITASWQQLTRQLDKPCPVFAYPTGRKEDFSSRDIEYLKEAGLQGAVTAEPGAVNFSEFTEADKYLIKRMSFPETMEDLIQYCSGFELKKQELRDLNLKIKHTTKSKLVKNAWILVKYKLGLYDRYRKIDWSVVSRLVFVCKGNICRSPYAEMKARELGIEAVSIGLDTKPGSPANTSALRNAAYRSINLAQHEAKTFESITFSATDLVICMEPWHVQQFKALDHSGCQVSLLGLWSPVKKIIISDPYGKPDVFFEDCFVLIDNALMNIKNLCQA